MKIFHLCGLICRTVPHSARTIYCAHGWSFTTNASPSTKRTDAIIVISRSEFEAAIAAGIDAQKCTIVYNGVEERPPVPAARSEDSTILALFVGRLDEQKGYDVLIDAFRLLGDEDIRLTIIGEAVQGRGGLPDLPTNVTAHGWMTHSELYVAIAAADVVVVPSRWEGFGLVAIEAMREGKPLIAHKVGGLPEIVADGETGLLFSPLDAPTLAAVLTGLDKQRLRDMGRAARQRFEAMFTDRTMFAATDRIYRRVLPARLFGHVASPVTAATSLPAVSRRSI